ncbi:hypothetical protein MKSMC1_29410 [Mycobacterium kansasii]|nr:hypothetical protein MKSMC1_29410 [Mycobacterium kansasii]
MEGVASAFPGAVKSSVQGGFSAWASLTNHITQGQALIHVMKYPAIYR